MSRASRRQNWLQAALLLFIAAGGAVIDHDFPDDTSESVNLLQVQVTATPVRDVEHGRGLVMLGTDGGATLADSRGKRVGLIIAGLAVAGILTRGFCGKETRPFDIVAISSSAWIVMLTGYGMFGPVTGGRQKLNNWFAWHPVFMVAAFMFFMVLGRWTYTMPAGGADQKDMLRRIHRVLNLLGAIALLLGYIAIFKAHWKDKKYFGYYFHAEQWAVWPRIVHIYFGYATIFLTLAQVAMGVVKYENLKEDRRSFTFHGTLGKTIITMAGITVIFAIWSWSWSSGLSGLLGALTATCVLFGTLWPKPEA